MAPTSASPEASSSDAQSQGSTGRSTSPSIGVAPTIEVSHRYYVVHDEAIADGITYAQPSAQSDGYTLYRALARMLIGDPTRHGAIVEAVLNFAIREVYWIIAHALGIRIAVYATITPEGELRELLASAGATTRPTYSLLKTTCDGPIQSRFSGLMPDESGKELIEYLLSTKAEMTDGLSGDKFHGLEIKKMVWAWKKRPGGLKVSCFNEHRPKSTMEDLDLDRSPMKRMDVMTIVVNEANQLPAALDIFKKAMELAPGQKRKVLYKDRRGQQALVDSGEVEELCSVVSIAIGRHLCIIFNVLQMMEHPNEQTVPALYQLFSEVIFDARICKLWWNLQSDFTVMNNTIAHLYQGTPREAFSHTSYRGVKYNVTPTWKLQSPFFNGERPEDLSFPSSQKPCDLHAGSTEYVGMSCPCQTGNIDIAALLNHFCRLQGGFYQNLGGPNMQNDDCAMAYNIGDVVGQNLAFEQLMANDDVKLTADCLERYATKDLWPAPRPFKQMLSKFKETSGIPLYEDNSRLFTTQRFVNEQVSETKFVVSTLTSDTSLWNTKYLSPWEHDRRVEVSRSISSPDQGTPVQSTLFRAPTTKEQEGLATRKKKLMTRLTDPRRLWLPVSCANLIEEEYEGPVVRAGTTQSEALLEFALSEHVVAGTTPPPGFGAAIGSGEGLPGFLKRRPGTNLPLAKEIYKALSSKRSSIRNTSGAATTMVEGREPRVTQSDLTPKQMAEKAVEEIIKTMWCSREQVDDWLLAHYAKQDVQAEIDKEEEINLMHGLPSVVDHGDVFDPEGREYRRMVEGAAD
ncbi:uncharacterized protein MYCGRDRAFT_94223 [Zymoseptoria tritici IPO323]|uniref:Uncharacterized protein n=1 Tax=Zymoseptoria tritici (strain CBS 115943 / IPO323) TaxID=336722 RepID=F9XGE1_ZYMTI|nr:uncharacterized protein MYCGRDRAFT_94223 [Zymoseptoria tritici IPO323]EGP85544.1 hypothetical protein MYCGRDRAFT_94223 [Zymoseptoria tritici IPO323]